MSGYLARNLEALVSDELRPWIEDRPDFILRSYAFSLLHVARRIQSPVARAALSEQTALRTLLAASAARIDSSDQRAALHAESLSRRRDGCRVASHQ